jgi:hypothetical protein
MGGRAGIWGNNIDKSIEGGDSQCGKAGRYKECTGKMVYVECFGADAEMWPWTGEQGIDQEGSWIYAKQVLYHHFQVITCIEKDIFITHWVAYG